MEQIHQNSAVCYGLLSGLTVHVAVGVDGITVVAPAGKGGGVTEGSPGAGDPGSGSLAF